MRQRVVTLNRRAFNLDTLVVAMAIIAVFVALLLPPVEVARESRRQEHCRNILKPDGLAPHNYITTHERFPIMLSLRLLIRSDKNSRRDPTILPLEVRCRGVDRLPFG